MSTQRAMKSAAITLAASLVMCLCGCGGGSGTAEHPPKDGEARPVGSAPSAEAH